MNPMLKNLLLTLLKTFGYVFIGLVIRWITQSLTSFHPEPGTETFLWTYVFVPALAGLVKVLKRLLTWDPTKVGA